MSDVSPQSGAKRTLIRSLSLTAPEPFATYAEALEALADRLDDTMQFAYVQ